MKLVTTLSLSGLIIPHVLPSMVKQICPALLAWAFSPYLVFVHSVCCKLLQRILPPICLKSSIQTYAWSLLVHHQMERITYLGINSCGVLFFFKSVIFTHLTVVDWESTEQIFKNIFLKRFVLLFFQVHWQPSWRLLCVLARLTIIHQ